MSRTRHLVALAIAAAALSACNTVQKVGSVVNPFDGGESKGQATAPQDDRISILAYEQKLEQDPALAGRTPTLPEAVALADWPQASGPDGVLAQNIAHAGAFNIEWRRDVGAGSSNDTRISAPPVVADGKVFLIDSEQRLSAYRVEGGSRLWSKDLTPRKGRDKVALTGGVAFADGKLFVTSGFGFAAAFDAGTGEQVWRTDVESPFHAAPTVSRGRVFAVTNDSELLAMDATTGQVLWTHQAIAEPARILAASSPAVKDDTVIAPFASGELVALLAPNGRRLWVDALTRAGRLTSLSAINDIAGRPVVIDGIVYSASHSGILAAIDQRTGQRIWARGLSSTQTPWVAGDTVFVVTIDGELAALERTTGQAFWVTQLQRYEKQKDKKGRIAWSGPILAGGKLFLASSEGEAVVVDPLAGAVEKTLRIGGPVYIPPVAAGDTIYLLSDEGKLIAVK